MLPDSRTAPRTCRPSSRRCWCRARSRTSSAPATCAPRWVARMRMRILAAAAAPAVPACQRPAPTKQASSSIWCISNIAGAPPATPHCPRTDGPNPPACLPPAPAPQAAYDYLRSVCADLAVTQGDFDESTKWPDTQASAPLCCLCAAVAAAPYMWYMWAAGGAAGVGGWLSPHGGRVRCRSMPPERIPGGAAKQPH